MRLYQVEGGGADFEKLKIVVLWGHFLTLSSIFQVAATCHHQKFLVYSNQNHVVTQMVVGGEANFKQEATDNGI